MINVSTRYIKNKPSFSDKELDSLRDKKVAICGLGGLGGYVAMALIRFGIQKLTLIDYDTFEVTNLNRQLFAMENNIGELKAMAAKKNLLQVDNRAEIEVITEKITLSNSHLLLNNQDIVMDCLDNLETRFILDTACKELDTPYIHGAIDGFYGHIATILPGDNSLEKIYPRREKTALHPTGNLVYLAQIVAGIQVSEAIKVLLGKEKILRRQLLHIDLLENECISIKL